MSSNNIQHVLICGATGYVGGRLVPRFLERGLTVRCLVRSPEKLRAFPWHDHPNLEVIEGNLDDVETVRRSAEGTHAAYYLVHAMISAGGDYAQRDRELATSFVEALKGTSCQRIVYLGGLGELGPNLSDHLASRREVAQILQTSDCAVTVFRAAMIIGSGSASFEILRYLVERLPIMVTPKWVKMETQPIAIRDVLRYLVECLDVPETAGSVIDIGGQDVFSYQDLMQLMAKALGLRRRIIVPVPVLTPKLSSAWISLVTPVNARIARPLAEGLRNRTVCRNDVAQQLMPGPLFDVQDAIDAALGKLKVGNIETRWSTAGEMPGDPEWSGGKVFQDERSCVIDASPQNTFAALSRIGGRYGYWGGDWLWWVRGLMDKAIGGPGLRRGRRHPSELSYGEAVDFWRINGYEDGSWLRLHAEMKLPGDAELDFQVHPHADGKSELVQTARFRPRGLLGIAYWWAVYPLHFFVFPNMVNGIKRDAETLQSNGTASA
ncbi:SDR family oxidoreductase [Stieleria marina]|uniref:SDR family oxidoreductase n=1 Tax=Stieleria marina TaxID=1930275 RepID=UPI003AF3A4A5